MKISYDGVCRGSLDLLAGRELYRLAKELRFGGEITEENEEEQANA